MHYDKGFAQLLKSIDSSNEGALLNNTDPCILFQTNLIERTLTKYKPQYIIETGTNKGFFSFICLSVLDQYEPSVLIDTFDEAKFSAVAVDMVNGLFPRHRVIFHLGDSMKELKTFKPSKPIDLFYVDGGHTVEITTSDLKHAVEWNAPLILVDDTAMSPVAEAMRNELTNYILIDQTEQGDDRRMQLWSIKA